MRNKKDPEALYVLPGLCGLEFICEKISALVKIFSPEAD